VARWVRWSLSVADPFVCRCLTSHTMRPFPHPAHRTGRADLPHPALGEDSCNRQKPLHVTPPATLENSMGVCRLIANLPSFVASFVRLQLRPLPSTGITRLHQYYEPLRHPSRPDPSLTSCQLIHTANHRWDFPCCVWSPLPACRHQYPGRTDGILFARILPSTSAFPEIGAGRLLH
jgi:hypothetical protein